MIALLLLALPVHAGDLRVVGGQPAEEGAWPDAVALFAGDTFRCSGVLVAPDLVLTAAHCDFGLTHAVVGATDHAVDGESIAITETFSHPRSWATYDVAAVLLDSAASAAPRPLALDCILDTWLYDAAPVAVVGFGATDEWGVEMDSVLMEASTEVVDHDCSDPAFGCNEEVSPGGELVAGGDGVDSCSGDSGGPLYLRTGEGDFLVGLTSRGISNSETLCGDGGVYVRPDAVIGWIEETADRTLPRPDCSGPRNHPPQPAIAPITIAEGRTAERRVEPNDPDRHDAHVFALESFPEHGVAEIDEEGRLRYTADVGYAGPDRLTVLVTDDGEPPLPVRARVDVEVLPMVLERGTCGCGGGAGAGPWLLLAFLVRRRR